MLVGEINLFSFCHIEETWIIIIADIVMSWDLGLFYFTALFSLILFCF